HGRPAVGARPGCVVAHIPQRYADTAVARIHRRRKEPRELRDRPALRGDERRVHRGVVEVHAALITSQGRAIAQFARFLAAAVDSSNGGVRVSLWDVRYHAPGSGADGWATVQVPLR